MSTLGPMLTLTLKLTLGVDTDADRVDVLQAAIY